MKQTVTKISYTLKRYIRFGKSIDKSSLPKGAHQKKASFFWTLSKSGLDPPLIFDIVR